jgi:hypothetical protein
MRREHLLDVLERIGDPHYADLVNVPGRANALELVERRYPGEPVETVLRWAEELCEDSEAGTRILDAGFPEELEIDAEEQPEIFLAALRYFAAGGEVPEELEDFPANDVAILREALLRSSLRALVWEDSPASTGEGNRS